MRGVSARDSPRAGFQWFSLDRLFERKQLILIIHLVISSFLLILPRATHIMSEKKKDREAAEWRVEVRRVQRWF
jgi:hypothetical protein